MLYFFKLLQYYNETKYIQRVPKAQERRLTVETIHRLFAGISSIAKVYDPRQEYENPLFIF